MAIKLRIGLFLWDDQEGRTSREWRGLDCPRGLCEMSMKKPPGPGVMA